jgi:hypothetical protein
MQRRGGGFFGRRKGKALRPGQKRALETALPLLRLDVSAPPPHDLTALFPVTVSGIRLEIGFGGGEHLIAEAHANPEIGFIGIEPIRMPPFFLTGCRPARLRASICSLPIRGQNGGIGSAASSGGRISIVSRGALNQVGISVLPPMSRAMPTGHARRWPTMGS